MSRYDHSPRIEDRFLTRRQMLQRCGMGVGALALGNLLAQTGFAQGAGDAINPLAVKNPHFPGKAKRVIHLFMNGGPSQVDTFDPKPALEKYAGKLLPTPNLKTERRTGAAMPSPYKFSKHGQSGIEVSEIFPNVAKCVDDLCVIRSMQADVPNHEPSLLLMNCGEARLIRPSMGSWLTYGLGSANQNLPGFVVMCPGGYLPGVYQGTYVDTAKTELNQLIEHIKNSASSPKEQRRQLDLLMQLNR